MKHKFFFGTLMMMMMLMFISSCKKDFLDPKPTDRLSETTVWASLPLIEATVNRVYNDLNYGIYAQYAFGEDNQMLAAITDEVASIYEGYEGRIVLINGTLNDQNSRGHRLNRLGWREQYSHISLANEILQRMETVTVLSEADKNRIIGEVKVLRGFHYFNLLKHFGGLILIDKPFKLGDDYNAVSRSSIEETFAFIMNDVNEGIALLPETASKKGRIDKGVAQALRARILLYAASPLFNNNTNDPAKWQVAADASKAIIDGGKFSLEMDFEKYRKSFFVHDPGSPEVIFAEEHTVLDGPAYGPYLNPSISFGTTGAGGLAYCTPIQQLVDDYSMANGKLINEPGSGYDPQKPFVNRDPRFDAFIWSHGSKINERPLDFRWSIGFDMQIGVWGNPTGYTMRKFVNDARFNATATALINPFGNDPTPWIIFRYAEVLLNYAEAINEADGPDNAYSPVNLVRQRAGIPVLPPGLSQSEMREKIRHERRIELVFEEHRFFDVRRWKIAEQTENITVERIHITGNIGNEVYSVATAEGIDFYPNRVFLPHHYFWPISFNEILINPNLVQNPGY